MRVLLSIAVVLVGSACKDPTVPYERPPVDEDFDGVPYEQDCDDQDPEVYPGAPEWCDGKIQDCGGSEQGLVTFDPADGPREDWTERLADLEGSTLRIERSGTLSICDAAFELALVAAASDVEVQGVGVVTLTQPEEASAALAVEGGGSTVVKDLTLQSQGVAVQGRSGKVVLRRVTLSGGGVELVASAEQDFARVVLSEVVVLDVESDPAVHVAGAPLAKLDLVVSRAAGAGLLVHDVDELELGAVEVRDVQGLPIALQVGTMSDGGLLGRMQVQADVIDGTALACILDDKPCGRVEVGRAVGLQLDLVEAGGLEIYGSSSIGVSNFLVERSVGDGLVLEAPEVRVFRGTALGAEGTALTIRTGFGQLQRVSFQGNRRGLWLESEQPFTLSGGTFTGNGDFAQDGGGMWVSAPRLTLIGSTLEDNLGRQGGGGFVQGVLEVERSDLIGNQASWGGVFRVVGDAFVEDSSLFENQAGIGGALHVDGDVISEDSAWRRNRAELGGALYLTQALTSDGSLWGYGVHENAEADVFAKDCDGHQIVDGAAIDLRCEYAGPKK